MRVAARAAAAAARAAARAAAGAAADARALGALRVALGAFVLRDLRERTREGAFSLAWYTSEPAYASMLAPSDTPHGAWLHVAVWFARGGTVAQACAFGATAVLAAAFAAGVGAGPLGPTSVLLWLAVTAMHGRCEAVCDGADHYLRAVLLWCMLLPMDRALTLRATCARLRSHAGSHARARTRKRAHASVGEEDVSEADDGGEGAEGPIVRGYAVCGLCLQMCFMYWGTVMHRWEGQSWWLPRLDAVYYALASNFGTRAWVSALVLPRPWLWRFMTASAVCVEGLAPVLLVVGVCACGRAREGAGGRKERAPSRVHLAARRRDGGSVSAGGGFGERTALAARTAGALALAALHAGLMVAMRLANWQMLGATVALAWLPTCAWDAAQDALARLLPGALVARPGERASARAHAQTSARARAPRNERAASRVAACALVYMTALWAGERGWVPKVDGGNVGEALRLSQYWVMYGPNPPRETTTVTLTAELADSTARLDVLRALRTGDWGPASEVTSDELAAMLEEDAEDMSERYPSMRWERALHRWGRREGAHGARGRQPLRDRGHRLARAVCTHGLALRPDLVGVHVTWRGATILPPGAPARFEHASAMDERAHARCRGSEEAHALP